MEGRESASREDFSFGDWLGGGSIEGFYKRCTVVSLNKVSLGV